MRSRTWDRLKFEVEYSLQRGTTANSYLIQADKTALIDPQENRLLKHFWQHCNSALT
jgi:flavorubredoxin